MGVQDQDVQKQKMETQGWEWAEGGAGREETEGVNVQTTQSHLWAF